MSKSKQKIGSVSWIDLTVPDAKKVRNFYKSVTGWTASPVKMGSYSDFCINEPKSGKTVAGICHARGDNKDLPPQWLIYITVADVEASAKKCLKLGGKVLSGPRDMGGYGRVAVIEDPAGAVAAIFQPA